LASVAAGNGAGNNTVRNLEISAGVDQSVSGTATFGIIMSGTTISVTANGVDNDNNSFIANRITKARYGIVTRGTTTDLNINPIITDNIVVSTPSFAAVRTGWVSLSGTSRGAPRPEPSPRTPTRLRKTLSMT
jgi:hypothetical protein